MKNLFILLTLLSISLGQVLPRLPSAFIVDIEANLLDLNLTINFREYFDLPAGFARYESLTPSTYNYTILDLNQKLAYNVVNESICTISPEIPDTFANAQSAEDLLLFGDKFSEMYLGTSTVRGVPCDTWISYSNYTDPGTTLANGTVVNAGDYHNFSIQYYFSSSSWGFRSGNLTQKPMRAILSGSITSLSGAIRYYYHNYEYTSFVARTPIEPVFVLPTVCVPVSTQVIRILQSSSGAGLAAGMFFLGLFLGILFTALSIWIYCRRRQMARDKLAKSSENYAPQ